jgi:hypothetical protein
LEGKKTGKKAAAIVAAGAALGSLGLFAFATTIWSFVPFAPWEALALATFTWFIISVIAWRIRQKF